MIKMVVEHAPPKKNFPKIEEIKNHTSHQK